MRNWLFLAAFAAACAGGSKDETTDEPTDAIVGDATAGGTVYSNNCAGCHSADGSGGSGPSLIAEVPELSDDEITTAVLEGKGGMPSFDLDDQEMADLLAYLRDSFDAGM